MSANDVREEFNRVWEEIDLQAERDKDAYRSVLELQKLYVSLSQDERLQANQVIAEWALADEPKRRFTALALIDRYLIRSAVPALEGLARRFADASGPSAPYDLAKVNRILHRLSCCPDGTT